MAEWLPKKAGQYTVDEDSEGRSPHMSLVKELQRRNVFRVVALYLVLSWLILKATHVLIDLAGLERWVRHAFEIILSIGLPFVIWFAWAFEVTPQGLKRESDVEPEKSITTLTGRKIDSAILIVIIIGVAILFLDKMDKDEEPPPPTVIE